MLTAAGSPLLYHNLRLVRSQFCFTVAQSVTAKRSRLHFVL